MYKKTATRDKKGRIIHQVRFCARSLAATTQFCGELDRFPAEDECPDALWYMLQDLQSKELPNTRIQPDRRWFGNTRVIGQKQLEQFREEMSAKVSFSPL